MTICERVHVTVIKSPLEVYTRAKKYLTEKADPSQRAKGDDGFKEDGNFFHYHGATVTIGLYTNGTGNGHKKPMRAGLEVLAEENAEFIANSLMGNIGIKPSGYRLERV